MRSECFEIRNEHASPCLTCRELCLNKQGVLEVGMGTLWHDDHDVSTVDNDVIHVFNEK